MQLQCSASRGPRDGLGGVGLGGGGAGGGGDAGDAGAEVGPAQGGGDGATVCNAGMQSFNTSLRAASL